MDHDPNVSYSLNHEDVRIWKALSGVGITTYVDVGAAHPIEHSDTRLFHDRGWRGVNIEPGPHFSELVSDRPDDVNLELAVASSNGSARFALAIDHPNLSSLDLSSAENTTLPTTRWAFVDVATRRLDSILDESMGDRPIGFLKIDVEGTEADVIASNDWSRHRPIVVVVEAVSPGTLEPSHLPWEQLLLDAGYVFAFDDGINRFYAREDHPEVRERLALPVSPADGFIPWHLVVLDITRAREVALEEELAARIERNAVLQSELEQRIERMLVLARKVETLEALASASETAHEATRSDLDDATATRSDLLRRAVERDRQLKEATAELARARTEVASLHSILHGVEAQRDSIAATHARQSATWSLRVGRNIVSRVRRFRPILGIPARAIHRSVRRHRVRPERLAAEVAEFTAAGRPLATTSAWASSPSTSPDANASDRLRAEILRRRTDGPHLLDPDEWDAVVSTVSSDPSAAIGLQRLAVLHTAIAEGETCAPRGSTLVIDVTGAQLVNQCGTRTHARRVLDQALDSIPPSARVLLWQSPLLPRLGPEFTDRTDGDWDPRHLEEVGAFLQLAPFIHPRGDTYIELIASPHVRRAGIWLDAIIGSNPAFFLPTAEQCFEYQFGIEVIGRLDRVLSLSDCSAAEAVALGVDPHRAVTTGCRPGLGSPSPTTGVSPVGFADHIVVVGNGLPHKNLALGIAGCLPLVADREDLGIVAVANISAEQEFELRELLDHLGVRRDRLDVRRLIADAEFEELIVRAKAVVIPSLHEGYSLSVAESIDRGTPVVLSDIAAHRELLGDGEWLFDPVDVNSLTRTLRRVIADRGRMLAIQMDRHAGSARDDRFIESIRSTVEWLCAEREIPSTSSTSTDPIAEVTATEERPACSISKICELEDFADPALREAIRSVFAHELDRFGPDFPDGREYRKYWEVAMAVRAFEMGGLLDGTRTFLGIGAGNEPTIFHLTRTAKGVLATDLYEIPGWEESANVSMLTDPGSHWPFEWHPTALTVMNMDALALDLPDESIAGVFSSSSVEHFGDRDAVRRSIDEAYRVLEPGGILSVSSEFRISGDRPGIPGALLFDEDDIADIFIGRRDWSLMEPFDPTISAATIATQQDFDIAAADQNTSVDRLGGLWTHHVEYAVYPHLVLRHLGRRFTSFHLALQKAC